MCYVSQITDNINKSLDILLFTVAYTYVHFQPMLSGHRTIYLDPQQS